MIYYILCIHSSVDGHMGCFDLLDIVTNTVMNIGVQIFVSIPAFNCFENIPRSGIAGPHGNSRCNFFEEPLCCFPQQLYYFTFPPAVHEGSSFSTSSPTLIFFCLFAFDNCYPNEREVVSH